MHYKLFADTNVYLDFLMHRGNDWSNAADIFRLAEQGVIELFTSSSSLLNIMYVMHSYKLSREDIIESAKAILSYTKLISPDNITFEIALSSGFRDMEDAVQYHTALEVSGISCFITSNVKDYKTAGPLLPVMTPLAFMKMYNEI